MQITDVMIEAALKKAVEAGWVQRNAMQTNYDNNREIMRGLLKAALDVMQEKKEPD